MACKCLYTLSSPKAKGVSSGQQNEGGEANAAMQQSPRHKQMGQRGVRQAGHGSSVLPILRNFHWVRKAKGEAVNFDPYTDRDDSDDIDTPEFPVDAKVYPEVGIASHIFVKFTVVHIEDNKKHEYIIPCIENEAIEVFWAIDEICNPYAVKTIHVANAGQFYEAETICLTEINEGLTEVNWHELITTARPH